MQSNAQTTGDNISNIRSRGFQAINQHLGAIQVVATALGELDARIFLADEGTVDDRLQLMQAARRLTLLLDGEVSR